MKKSAVAALVLVLGFSLALAASENAATVSYQVVVDGSTRIKVLNDYTILTRDAIQRAWKTPLDLNVPEAVKGRIRIDYTVKRSGALDAVRLVRGSGNSDMDRSLLNAIRAAQPFPPFPDEITAGRILIRANFIVADLPTVPVTTVNQPVKSETNRAATDPDKSRKKFRWGLPAGTSQVKQAPAPDPVPPRRPTKKYRWGANR